MRDGFWPVPHAFFLLLTRSRIGQIVVLGSTAGTSARPGIRQAITPWYGAMERSACDRLLDNLFDIQPHDDKTMLLSVGDRSVLCGVAEDSRT